MVLQVKKDYLNEGAMADSADLVVLGGWYGTGNKGGLISIFLMGCHDQFADRWRTVTKVNCYFGCSKTCCEIKYTVSCDFMQYHAICSVHTGYFICFIYYTTSRAPSKIL